MEKTAKIYVAGHHGLVGSAIWNNLQQKGYTNQEISKHYGVPMNHVRAWQSKARKYLQQDTKLYTLLS
mgnify:CR=1 FL=1